MAVKEGLFCNGCPHIAGSGDLWYCDKYTGMDADLHLGPEDNFYRCKKCMENTKEEKAMIRPLKAWRGYCGNCKTEFSFQDGAWNDDNCPVCGNTDPDYELIPIPDYETPAQYEKRTGKPFDDDGAVWYKKPYSHIDPKTKTETGEIKYSRWLVSDYERIKMQQFMGILRNCIVVIASPPVPPPDDWEPEEA